MLRENIKNDRSKRRQSFENDNKTDAPQSRQNMITIKNVIKAYNIANLNDQSILINLSTVKNAARLFINNIEVFSKFDSSHRKIMINTGLEAFIVGIKFYFQIIYKIYIFCLNFNFLDCFICIS